MKRLLALIFILALSCATARRGGPEPAQLQDNYALHFGAPLAQRLDAAPAVLLDRLMAMDGRKGYANHVLTPEEKALVERTLARLPDSLRAPLEAKLGAIYFVDDFPGGGMTWALWKNGEACWVFVFNPRTLRESLSAWLSYRDNTAFAADSGYTLEEKASGDEAGFLHTGFHEAAHVYDFAKGLGMSLSNKDSAFSAKVWKDLTHPLDQNDFKTRSGLSFYDIADKPKVKLSDFAADFDSFAAGPFASVYGAQNAMDDLAEAVAYNYLKSACGVSVVLELKKDGRTVKTYDPLANPRVEAQFEGFLASTK